MRDEFIDSIDVDLIRQIMKLFGLCGLNQSGRLARIDEPTSDDLDMLDRIAKRRVKKRITRRDNPTGGKVTKQQLRAIRKQYAAQAVANALASR